MKRMTTRMGAFAVVSISAFVYLTGPLSAQPSERIELPDIKVGDAWVLAGANSDLRDRKTTEWKTRRQITSVNGTVATYDYQNLPPSRSSSTGTGQFDFSSGIRISERDVVSGKQEAVRFPLRVGDEWNYDFAVRVPNGTAEYRMKAKAVGWEEVSVTAGKFRALRVEHEGYWAIDRAPGQGPIGTWTAPQLATYWYAPTAKTFIKAVWLEKSRFGGDSFRSEWELVEFQPAQ